MFGQRWLYSGKNGCIRAKWLFTEKSGCILAKVVIFEQSGCIRETVVVFVHKVDVFGQKCIIVQNGCRSGSILAN